MNFEWNKYWYSVWCLFITYQEFVNIETLQNKNNHNNIFKKLSSYFKEIIGFSLKNSGNCTCKKNFNLSMFVYQIMLYMHYICVIFGLLLWRLVTRYKCMKTDFKIYRQTIWSHRTHWNLLQYKYLLTLVSKRKKNNTWNERVQLNKTYLYLWHNKFMLSRLMIGISSHAQSVRLMIGRSSHAQRYYHFYYEKAA